MMDMNTITTIDHRCIKCFLKTYRRLLEKFDLNRAAQEFFGTTFQKTLKGKSNDSHPIIQAGLNRALREIAKVNDLFAHEKNSAIARLLNYMSTGGR